MSNAQKERHNKYVMALNELLANASYLGDLPNKETEFDLEIIMVYSLFKSLPVTPLKTRVSFPVEKSQEK